jgi:hypothetical protein
MPARRVTGVSKLPDLSLVRRLAFCVNSLFARFCTLPHYLRLLRTLLSYPVDGICYSALFLPVKVTPLAKFLGLTASRVADARAKTESARVTGNLKGGNSNPGRAWKLKYQHLVEVREMLLRC